MLHDFNLLITTTRGSEMHACSETWYLLSQIGDPDPETDKAGISGLITAKTSFQPQEAIEKLRVLLKEHPYEFRYTLRVIPIQKVTHTDLHEIEQVATQLAQQIQHDETFRITVEKRFTNTPTGDIIEAAARNIENKVSLTNPDKILLIEVVGKLTGLSILRSTDIMSTTKERTEN
ncbi:MAG: THUMP domain-containing protein [Candidatus Bathyarchaeota archaeon]|nr:THUMP domain-containing protein [Candidatus Bathyarchaeota archaeon]